MTPRRRSPRSLAAVALPVVLVLTVAVAAAETAQSDACAGPRWVSTWTTAHQDAGDRFVDQTVRSIVTPTVDGSQVRITLSNRFGDRPVTFDDVHVATSLGGASVNPETIRPVSFGGQRSVTIRPGRVAVSDPAPLEVRRGDDLAVSYHVDGGVPLDRHHEAMQTSYMTPPGSGRHGAAVVGSDFTVETTTWYALASVDVLSPRPVGAVAVLGDSITEGLGSTPDAGQRWPDHLARRTSGRTAVLNAGIGGNHASRDFVLVHEGKRTDFGPGAVDRLRPDVLARAGVTDLVVFIGINDVFTQISDDVVADVTRSYRQIARRADRAGLRVIGATLTPASLDPEREADRRAINEWIRSAEVFDAVVDFERVVADPSDPTRLRPRYDADRVHLTDAGYAALGRAFDESLLQGTGCAA